MSITFLNPAQEPVELKQDGHKLAPRLGTLTGKTIGFYGNVKLNAIRLLDHVCAELQKEYSFNVVRGTYNAARLMDDAEWGPDIWKCDAVVLTNGDCGSCSSSGIANAIELEKHGIPTLLLSTPPFYGVVKTMAELRGMPAIQWAVIDHPIGSLKDDELRQRAVVAAQQFRELIMQPELKSSAA